MTKPHEADEGARDEGRAEMLECSKCGHLNKRPCNTCSECGAHLHVVCHECGHRNERIADECVECGKRLHRSLWRRLEKKLFKRNPKMNVWQFVLLVVAVYVAYKIIVKLAEFRPVIIE